MSKPQMKRQIAIHSANSSTLTILVKATQKAVEYISQFGEVDDETDQVPDGYTLWVDPRYDFMEVLKHIKEYGQNG